MLMANEVVLRNLLIRGLTGDAVAYHEFLKAVSAHLRSFLKKRLTNLPHEVEDVVQESLLAIHNQRHTYDADQPVTAWVHAIAKYKLVDLLRRRGNREALNDSLDDDDSLSVSAGTEAIDARRDIAKLLNLLPERQRLPILHVKLEGLSVAEAASITGMSESAIKIGVHRGLKALAAKFRGNT
jgi:RNA polymerase sigma-70 factor (ECF subfamily)